MRPLSKIVIKDRHRRILALIRNNTARLVLAAGCSLMVSLATTATGYLIKPVIDDIFVNKDTTGLVWLPLLVIAVFFVKGVGSYGQEYFMNYVGEDIIRRLRNQLYDRIQDLPLAFFQKERTGVLMSRITNDVNILKAMVSTAVTGSLRDLSTVIGLTVVIFYLNWRMAILAFVVFPVAFIPVVILGQKVRRVSTGCQEAIAELSAFLHETFAGNKIVKAFGREQHEKRRFFDHTQRLFALEIKGVKVRALASPIMEFFGGIGIAFVIWYGGSQVISGQTTPGTFMSFLACVLLIYDPVRKLSQVNNTIQQGMAAADRVFDIIETPSGIPEPPRPRPMSAGPHDVHFSDVHFSYGDKPVLKGIDLRVPHGQILALVGMSGGGKTTLVNLIPRFFDVTGGAVRIDDHDIREYAVADLRREIAIVTQEPILFNETVHDNIAYGKPQADRAAVVKAAQAAYAHDFIERFPKGYDTVIGELGGRLSGGEKQRLCIARALLKDAPILILDEATSSLDTEAEALVQKALENLMQGRTTFVIAHRLSTIAKADHIVVIVDGRIAEQGSHQALMGNQREYAKLYDMQFAAANSSTTGNVHAGTES
jgi:subfamily B ATP-binding cassette protein MsbA